MKASVRSAFLGFTIPLEGAVAFMYCDILGLVTTAVGVLVDPKPAALSLPFVHPDGRAATQEEIAADWDRVKARQDLKMKGGLAYKSVAQLRLTPAGLEEVTLTKLLGMERELVKRFPAFDTWPADAQLATFSMAWACGPWFKFPALANALTQQDFAQAALTCHINTDGPDGVPGTIDDNRGVIPRNVANKTLYRNAHAVLHGTALDPEVLYYPADLNPLAAEQADLSTILGYQRALLDLGYDVGAVDGYVGAKTTAAVKRFQADNGLDTDGRVGPKTQHMLLLRLQQKKGA